MILSVIAATLVVALTGVPASSNPSPDTLAPAAKDALVSAAEVATIYLLEELRIQKEITGFQGKHATASRLPKSENARLSANLAKKIRRDTLSSALSPMR